MSVFSVDDIMSDCHGIIISPNMHLLTPPLLVSFTSGELLCPRQTSLSYDVSSVCNAYIFQHGNTMSLHLPPQFGNEVRGNRFPKRWEGSRDRGGLA